MSLSRLFASLLNYLFNGKNNLKKNNLKPFKDSNNLNKSIRDIKRIAENSNISEENLRCFLEVQSATFFSCIDNEIAESVWTETIKGILVNKSRREIRLSVIENGMSRDQMEVLINTSLSTFSRSISIAMQNQMPKESKLVFEGPLDEKTRPICIEMMSAGPLTVSQIDVRFMGSRIDGGGFNCRHRWISQEATNINQKFRANKIKTKLIAEDKFGDPKTLLESFRANPNNDFTEYIY